MADQESDRKYWRNLKFRNQTRFEERVGHYEDFSNKIFTDLTKQLILLNTFVLTFTSPIFISKINLGDSGIKILLLIGWIFLFISIFAGIIQLIIEHEFHYGVSKFYRAIAEIYASSDDSEQGLAEASRQKNMEESKSFRGQSCLIPFGIQIFCFIVAIIFILIVFYKIMF